MKAKWKDERSRRTGCGSEMQICRWGSNFIWGATRTARAPINGPDKFRAQIRVERFTATIVLSAPLAHQNAGCWCCSHIVDSWPTVHLLVFMRWWLRVWDVGETNVRFWCSPAASTCSMAPILQAGERTTSYDIRIVLLKRQFRQRRNQYIMAGSSLSTSSASLASSSTMHTTRTSSARSENATARESPFMSAWMSTPILSSSHK